MQGGKTSFKDIDLRKNVFLAHLYIVGEGWSNNHIPTRVERTDDVTWDFFWEFTYPHDITITEYRIELGTYVHPWVGTYRVPAGSLLSLSSRLQLNKP